ncbi:hypothetical protein HDU98_011651 [Podochytrium sp. JEL0797]|nr:hypothetical protein HDU98_011651 [Podochytrium sp. JEL0797]
MQLFQLPVLLPASASPTSPPSLKRQRTSESCEPDTGDHDLSEAPPGIDAEAYAQAVGTSKGKRSQAQREIIKQARIVRNRIAAQTSRDKKRRSFEDLEKTNDSLRTRLASVEKMNADLLEHVKALTQAVVSLQANNNPAPHFPSPALSRFNSTGPLSSVPSPNLSPALFSEHDTPLLLSSLEPLFPSIPILAATKFNDGNGGGMFGFFGMEDMWSVEQPSASVVLSGADLEALFEAVQPQPEQPQRPEEMEVDLDALLFGEFDEPQRKEESPVVGVESVVDFSEFLDF